MSVDSSLRHALALHRSRRLAEAESAYRLILREAPEHPEALNHLGLLRYQRGDAVEALSLLRRAVAANPQSASCHLHLGLVLEQFSDFAAALAAYREAARLQPRAVDAAFNQGVVLLRLHRPEEAEECFHRVLSATPGDADAALNLGRALAGQRRWKHALDAFERALSCRSDWVEALNGKGGALRRMGRRQEALAAYRRALAVAPENAGLHNNLGNVLHELGRRREAKQAFAGAIELDERLAQAHLNLGRLRGEEGDFAGARSACRRALALDPNLAGARPALASMLRGYLPSQYDPALASELLRLMRAPDVDSQDLALAAASQVRARHRLSPRSKGVAVETALPVASLARDELLLELLTRNLNVDPDLEAGLVALRRKLLFGEGIEGKDEPETDIQVERLCAALALQCFANEYLFETSQAEADRVESLARDFAPPQPALALESQARMELLRLAMYRPLWRVQAARGLEHADESHLGGHLARVVERTLVEPLRERRLAANIASAGPVCDPVSRRVRDQYESSPYPRWLRIAAMDRSPVADSLKRRFFPLETGAGVRSRDPGLSCSVAEPDTNPSSLPCASRSSGSLRWT